MENYKGYLLRRLGWVLIVIIVIAFISKECKNSGVNSRPVEKDTKTEAYVMGQKFVKKILVSPSSANFPTYMEYNNEDVNISQEGKIYTITSYVDADNRFNANIRMEYVIVVENTSEDNWECISLNLDGIQYK